MFFSLILENAAGDQIDMTATAKQYMTSQIEGLSPPPEQSAPPAIRFVSSDHLHS